MRSADGRIILPVIAGPTASGKTTLAVEVCRLIGGEAVSADSMQIYRGMDIATAKPTPDETLGVPHHMIDFLEPSVGYSVAEYCRDASRCIEDIVSRGRHPVLVGGTGLYISSLLDGIRFIPEREDASLRGELFRYAEENGVHALHALLAAEDPCAAGEIHENNVVRVVRAIEAVRLSGETLSRRRELSLPEIPPYVPAVFVLNAKDRKNLFARIDARVDDMLERGLLGEAREFFASSPSRTAVQAIGFKELKPYLDGKIPFDEAVAALKQGTRRYAKRQLTWFRDYPEKYGARTLYIEDKPSADNVLG